MPQKHTKKFCIMHSMFSSIYGQEPCRKQDHIDKVMHPQDLSAGMSVFEQQSEPSNLVLAGHVGILNLASKVETDTCVQTMFIEGTRLASVKRP